MRERGSVWGIDWPRLPLRGGSQPVLAIKTDTPWTVTLTQRNWKARSQLGIGKGECCVWREEDEAPRSASTL